VATPDILKLLIVMSPAVVIFNPDVAEVIVLPFKFKLSTSKLASVPISVKPDAVVIPDPNAFEDNTDVPFIL
jgi:hypothetical protein